MENDKEENLDSIFNESSNNEPPSMFDGDSAVDNGLNSMFDSNTPANSEPASMFGNDGEINTSDTEKSEEKSEENPQIIEEKQDTPELEDKNIQAVNNEEVSAFEEEQKKTIENNEENISSSIIEENEDSQNSQNLVTVRPIKFKEFDETPPVRIVKKNYDIMLDIPMHISVELGRTKSTIREVIDLTKGSIIELDKIAGEQVEIYVNDKFVAKGEVIVIEDKFGVRVTNTNIQKNPANL